jgi:hypothetical protein
VATSVKAAGKLRLLMRDGMELLTSIVDDLKKLAREFDVSPPKP